MSFRLIYEPLSLERLSELAIYKNLWRQTMRQVLLGECCDSVDMKLQLESRPEARDDITWDIKGLEHGILLHMNDDIEALELPKEIKYNLKSLAKIMNYTNDTLLLTWMTRSKLDNVDHVKWTAEGTFDSIETMRSSYYSKVSPDSAETWKELSYYCLDDCLADFFGRVKSFDYNAFQFDVLLPSYQDDVINKRRCFETVLPVYWSKLMQNQLGEFTESLDTYLNEQNFYNKSKDLNINMFWLVINTGNFPAIKYFWEALTDNQRCQVVFERNAEILCNLFDTMVGNLELTFYMFKQLTPYANACFMNLIGNTKIMLQLVHSPWEDLFMRTLKEFCFRVDASDLHELIGQVFSCIHNVILRCHTDYYIKLGQIIGEIWYRLDDQSKKSAVWKSCDRFTMEDKLYDEIINDPAIDPDKWRRYIASVAHNFRKEEEERNRRL